MRNPGRIDVMLERLRDVWERNPDLRLGQIVCNAGQYGLTMPIYHVEDEELMTAIESVHENGRKP